MYYNSINEQLKKQYGTKVYKLALSGGMSCPNRDGTIDTRGCIFCSSAGSGDFAQSFDIDIAAQIEKAKQRVAKKAGDNAKYIAYFQSFTNTHASPQYLENIFMQAVNHPDIVILSVATRPDCLGDGVLDVLRRVAKIKPLWVELGLQTIHPKTASYIRRGYPLECYDKAVCDLHSIGATVITHVILGLPNETREMMLETVRYASKGDGVKLQLLHILKGTDLEKEYNEGKVTPLSKEEYLDILSDCVKNLPKRVVIHRLTGDGDKKLLVAPMWSANKRDVLNSIAKIDIKQGQSLDITNK